MLVCDERYVLCFYLIFFLLFLIHTVVSLCRLVVPILNAPYFIRLGFSSCTPAVHLHSDIQPNKPNRSPESSVFSPRFTVSCKKHCCVGSQQLRRLVPRGVHLPVPLHGWIPPRPPRVCLLSKTGRFSLFSSLQLTRSPSPFPHLPP